MDWGAKILNRILAKQIQQHIKKIIYHDQVGSITVQHTQINKGNTAFKQKQGPKSHGHFNRCRKAFDKIQYPFLIKALMKLGIEGML
jgi:hypothetical protein